MSAADVSPVESPEEFLARLQRLGANWRYSDEFIGQVVRSRYPRDYGDYKARGRVVVPAVEAKQKVRVRVWCSQFASCRWSGVRTLDPDGKTGVQEKPCPRCGKDVVR